MESIPFPPEGTRSEFRINTYLENSPLHKFLPESWKDFGFQTQVALLRDSELVRFRSIVSPWQTDGHRLTGSFLLYL